MLAPWLNIQITVQRRSELDRNVLNEPDYGPEADYPVVYDSAWARIEYNSKSMVFTDTGERVTLGGQTILMVEPEIQIQAEDRVTIVSTDDPEQLNKTYIIMEVYNEWNSVGNVHHYVATIEVH